MNRALTAEDIQLCQNVDKMYLEDLPKNVCDTLKEFYIFCEYLSVSDKWIRCSTEEQFDFFDIHDSEHVIRLNPLTPVGVRCNSYIVSAACKPKDVDIIITSPRHLDSICRGVLEKLGLKGYNITPKGQGFVDQYCTFFSREEAHIIAKANNQIRRRCGGDSETLYSENLY